MRLPNALAKGRTEMEVLIQKSWKTRSKKNIANHHPREKSGRNVRFAKSFIKANDISKIRKNLKTVIRRAKRTTSSPSKNMGAFCKL
jgi:hypothetical protein